MNVLFVSAEAAPFAKVGGMADVVGSLPAALRRLGVDARVVIPGYGFIHHYDYNIHHFFSFDFPRRTGTTRTHIYTTTRNGVPYYFVQGWPFFGSDSSVYTEWQYDVPRFLYFNQVVLEVALHLRTREDWFPDLLHLNDWHTGLPPFLIHENRNDPLWSKAATVVTIHNIGYQGDHAGGWLWELGIPGRHHPDLVYQDLTDNLLAIALAYSDIITTVSPRYAIEIQYPSQGYGLDALIRRRLEDLYGILNGMDTDLLDPETDRALVSNFNAENFAEKRPPNKTFLQKSAGLPVRDDVPVIGLVSRLVWQKGIDLALPALRTLLGETDVQFIALGTGDPDLMVGLGRLEQDFGSKVRAYLRYNAASAQHIYAGCDLFLMPSHFEPCGMGQMIAMRYGALPLVRETGGLADTVTNYDNADADVGTGFVFLWEEVEAVLNTMRWALDTYRNKQDAWRRMQQRAMRIDFSWDKSARQYEVVYQRALAKHKGK
jgi:starch synthase